MCPLILSGFLPVLVSAVLFDDGIINGAEGSVPIRKRVLNLDYI